MDHPRNGNRTTEGIRQSGIIRVQVGVLLSTHGQDGRQGGRAVHRQANAEKTTFVAAVLPPDMERYLCQPFIRLSLDHKNVTHMAWGWREEVMTEISYPKDAADLFKAVYHSCLA